MTVQRKIEVVTIAKQENERLVTTIQGVAKVDEKNGWIYIRYTEKQTGHAVLIKWNQANRLHLIRYAEVTNRLSFEIGQTNEVPYQTPAGNLLLTIETLEMYGRLDKNQQLEWLEWSYQLSDHHQILGNYQVKLHFLS